MSCVANCQLEVMRIALVTYGLHIGGMENFLFGLSAGLRAHGHTVTFIVTEDIGDWHDRPQEDGFERVTILPEKWLSRRRHAKRVSAVLEGFDVIILNHSAIAQTIVGQIQTPCVVLSILHNFADAIFKVGLANASQVDKIICVGTRILSEAQRRGAPGTKLVHLPYGIHVPAEWPKRNAVATDRPALKVMYVGRIEQVQKGVFDLPPILSKAIQLGANLTFEVVGSGGADFDILRRQFLAECPELKVCYHGRKNSADALRLLSTADVLLMPSRFEGFPIALLEAMSLGVVPVVSRLPGITDDAVTNEVDGIMPEVGDIDGFARAIVQLQDPEHRRKMSYAAWSSVHNRFRYDQMIERYLDVLRQEPRHRPSQAMSVGEAGQELFGLSWIYPIYVAKLWDAVRERRLGRTLLRHSPLRAK